MTLDSQPQPESYEETGSLDHVGPVRGTYWIRNNPQVQPNYWVLSKKLCECTSHNPDQWPVDHVTIMIPPCAFKCPYCTLFDGVRERERPGMVRLRKHIRDEHIVRASASYISTYL
ncbi:hypothetical protein N7475_003189, partial [Penicillium sp. IBT 31633x]